MSLCWFCVPIILFVDGQQKVRAKFLVQQLHLCLSLSNRSKIDYELFSQYNPNPALKYDLYEKGQYFMVHISYFETKINKIKNISIRAPLSDAHIDIFQFIQIFFNHNTCTAN